MDCNEYFIQAKAVEASFFIFSSCPDQVLNLVLRSRPDSGSLLKFNFAAVWATVRQRLCLKAVMADIAEIVVHGVLHFLCHVGAYMSSGYFSIPRKSSILVMLSPARSAMSSKGMMTGSSFSMPTAFLSLSCMTFSSR